MTYAETSKLVSALKDIETWAIAAQRELSKSYEDFDIEAHDRYKRWLDDAKQAVFDLVNK